VPLLVEFFRPETYARRPRAAMAMPPEAPGSAMVWTTFAVRVETMRMSLTPAPADTVQ
jgi:hypothetical protein